MKAKKELSGKNLSKKNLIQENANLREAMEVIRFLAFKHEIAYEKDATGTDQEKLNSILILARQSNWGYGGIVRSQEIKLKHLL